MYCETKISKIEIYGPTAQVWHNGQRFNLRNYDRIENKCCVNWEGSLYEKAGLFLAKS